MELNLKNVSQGFFSTSSMPSKVNLLQLLRMSRRDRRAVALTKTTLEVVEAMELNLKNVCQGFFSTSLHVLQGGFCAATRMLEVVEAMS